MKKKTIAFIMALCAAASLSLSACAGTEETKNETAGSAGSETTAETEASAPETSAAETAEAPETEAAKTEIERPDVITADVAMDLLKAGNANYLNPNVDADLRSKLTTDGQHPYAVVITCSDSRVAPEILFDINLGDIFTIRTAGNVVDAFETGSVEYGAEHLGSPLVVVLGHSNCGAVTAAVEGGEAGGSISAIVDAISPSVEKAKSEVTDENEVLDKAIELNVENSIAELRKSEILSELEEEGKLKIVGATYDIMTGEVKFLENTAPAEETKGTEEETEEEPAVTTTAVTTTESEAPEVNGAVTTSDE